MKYDQYQLAQTISYPNENVERDTKKKSKVNLLDVFVVQSIICVAISAGIIISKLIMMAF